MTRQSLVEPVRRQLPETAIAPDSNPKLDRLTAHLAVFDLGLAASGQVHRNSVVFTAVRALQRYEIAERRASRVGAGLEYRLEAIGGVDRRCVGC